MKTPNRVKPGGAFCRLIFPLILFCSLAQAVRAAGLLPPGDTNSPPSPLASWSFQDTNFWTSDQGYYPISFTNVYWSNLGDGHSLVVNAPGSPAYLGYCIYEPTNGATNLVLNAPGSLTFWYAPNWSSGTNGGTGPGQWAQLVSVGEWSPGSSVGYFGLSIDPSGSNIVFLSQDGAGNTYSLSAPISWTTNYFHAIAITYSATNVSLYLDGQLATNDPGGLSVWPNLAAIPNAVFFGSDTNGNEQAQGLFNTVQTYNTVLGSNDVQQIYDDQNILYAINPFDIPYLLSSGNSDPSTNSNDPNVITGSGLLQWDGTAANCSYSTNPLTVWITNLVATPAGGGTMNVTFSIDGGESGYYYDVFATAALEVPLANGNWAWFGQGLACNTYTITNVDSSEALLILGTPYDPETNNLTAAYSSLILHLNPYIYDQDGSGISDGWQVLLGLNPLINQVAQPGTRSNYSYTLADWIQAISGVKTGSVSMDNEGNVLTVSQ